MNTSNLCISAYNIARDIKMKVFLKVFGDSSPSDVVRIN